MPDISDSAVRELAQKILARAEYADARPSSTDTWLLSMMHRLFDWLGGLGGLRVTAPALYWLMIVGLFTVLAIMVAHIVWTISTALRAPEPPSRSPSGATRRDHAAEAELLLWIGEQHSWPARLLRDRDDGPAPSIDSFVESLGVLYSRANDPRAAFRAYRASFLRRARRQVSPRIDVPEPAMIERLTRDRSLSDEVRRCIVGDESPSTETELVRAVRALESCPSLIHEARRH